MIWVVVYLISVILLATTIGLILTCEEKEHVEIDDPKKILKFAACCMGWPLVIVSIPYFIVREYREHGKKKEANRLYKVLKMVTGDNARTEIISADEHTLKSLLKNARKGQMTLSDAQIEIVRNELLTRNMERNLIE